MSNLLCRITVNLLLMKLKPSMANHGMQVKDLGELMPQWHLVAAVAQVLRAIGLVSIYRIMEHG